VQGERPSFKVAETGHCHSRLQLVRPSIAAMIIHTNGLHLVAPGFVAELAVLSRPVLCFAHCLQASSLSFSVLNSIR
jgi:hypothetical protein